MKFRKIPLDFVNCVEFHVANLFKENKVYSFYKTNNRVSFSSSLTNFFSRKECRHFLKLSGNLTWQASTILPGLCIRPPSSLSSVLDNHFSREASSSYRDDMFILSYIYMICCPTILPGLCIRPPSSLSSVLDNHFSRVDSLSFRDICLSCPISIWYVVLLYYPASVSVLRPVCPLSSTTTSPGRPARPIEIICLSCPTSIWYVVLLNYPASISILRQVCPLSSKNISPGRTAGPLEIICLSCPISYPIHQHITSTIIVFRVRYISNPCIYSFMFYNLFGEKNDIMMTTAGCYIT